MKKAIIIGGGISGLSCARYLAESGYKVIVLEKEAVLGGLARSFSINGRWLPITYRHVLAPDKVTRAYINKLGFLNQLRWIKSNQVFWYENRSYLLSLPQHILRFNPIDLRSKIKLLNFGFYVWLKKNWDDLKGIDCDEWLTRMVGENTKEILFQNLMDIKFNMPLSSISAAWLGKRLHQSCRNINRYGYLKPGWQGLLEKLGERGIGERGVRIVNNFEVTRITSDCVIEGIGENGIRDCLSADIIISTVPPPIFNEIVDLPDKHTLLVQNISYQSVIIFVCGSRKKTSSYYWSVVLKPHLIFGGFFNITELALEINSEEYIYYFYTYIDWEKGIFQYDDERIKDIYLADIKKLFPDFSITWHRVFKIKFSQPVFNRDYNNPPIELTDKLFLAGVYRQYPRPRTMDAAFYSGLETAKHIVDKYGKG